MDELTALERAVIEMLLAGDDPILALLREQGRGATLTSRELTGVGFYTKFQVRPDAPRLALDRFTIGDVLAEIDGLANGASFLLWGADGCLDTLEGFTFMDPWPDEVKEFSLRYWKEPRELPFAGGLPEDYQRS